MRGIVKSYGRTVALRGVDLDVSAGEVVGLIGDNGAGKSTLIKILSGFERPDSGVIEVSGRRVNMSSPAVARSLGIETVYQEQALAEDLTVMENLFLGSERLNRLGPIRIRDSRRMLTESRRLLEELRLKVDPRQEARFCSGGEKQGIAIARAIHVKAKLVILDEPTNALGVVAVARVLGLIKELREQGIGCIFISHNIEHVVQVSDRVVMLVQGTKVLERKTEETSTMELVSVLNSRSGGVGV